MTSTKCPHGEEEHDSSKLMLLFTVDEIVVDNVDVGDDGSTTATSSFRDTLGVARRIGFIGFIFRKLLVLGRIIDEMES